MEEDAQQNIYTVSELTQKIKENLETNFFMVRVEGEISNLKIPFSGHSYFSLKDEGSQLKAVMFKSKNRYLKFELADGQLVVASGSISVYEPRGEYQVIVEYIEPKGVGALQLAFEQLKQKLMEEGLFDPKYKKSIPLLPQRIGIITSSTGAAIRDILKVINRRFANVNIIINPVRVQGDGAANEIAQAIEEMNELSEIDVIIVGRGGGSIEDLWAFNEEIVARSIFASNIPVISAVGHEIDYTISDFVADLRAPTPSAAAELVVQNKEELLNRLNSMKSRLYNTFKNKLDSHRTYFNMLSQKRVLLDPKRRIYDWQQKVDDFGGRLATSFSFQLRHSIERLRSIHRNLLYHHPAAKIANYQQVIQELKKKIIMGERHYLEIKHKELENVLGKLDTLSPLSILKRGYSICRKLPRLEVIKKAKEVKVEDRINVKVSEGEIFCRVEEVKG